MSDAHYARIKIKRDSISQFRKNYWQMVGDRYWRTLPYGFWFEASTKTEWLFDRDYAPIWSRKTWNKAKTLRRIMPELADFNAQPIRHYDPYVHFTEQGWFYDDATTPRYDKGSAELVGMVLARFMTGRDVRRLVVKWQADNHSQLLTNRNYTRDGQPITNGTTK